MSYQLVQSDDNKVLMYVIIAAVVFFVFILPKLEKCYARDNAKIKEKFEMLTLGEKQNENIFKLDEQKCSKKCCAHVQWPVPHMNSPSDEWVGSNFMCNGGGNDGGCLCVKDKHLDHLADRGTNYKPCYHKSKKESKFKNMYRQDNLVLDNIKKM